MHKGTARFKSVFSLFEVWDNTDGRALPNAFPCVWLSTTKTADKRYALSSPQHKKHVQFEAYGIVMRNWNTFVFFSEHKLGWAFWFSQKKKKRCRISFSGEMRHLSHWHINAVLIAPSSDDRYRCRCRRTSEQWYDGPQGRSKQRRKMQGHRCREG